MVIVPQNSKHRFVRSRPVVYPPKELTRSSQGTRAISSLGQAAVLTGALAVGLGSALDNVFVNRSRSLRA
jgi:hypothetical protein